jgi:hypothetical protein
MYKQLLAEEVRFGGERYEPPEKPRPVDNVQPPSRIDRQIRMVQERRMELNAPKSKLPPGELTHEQIAAAYKRIAEQIPNMGIENEDEDENQTATDTDEGRGETSADERLAELFYAGDRENSDDRGSD